MLGQVTLRRAFRVHGGTRDEFAREVIGYRDGRILPVWYKGRRRIPAKVVEKMKAYVRQVEQARVCDE